MLGMLKDIFMQSIVTKLCYLGVKGGLRNLKHMMDSEEIGGAPLLGAAKPVIKHTVPARPRASRTPSARQSCVLPMTCAAPCRAPCEVAAAQQKRQTRNKTAYRAKLKCYARPLEMPVPKYRQRAHNVRPLRDSRKTKAHCRGGHWPARPAKYPDIQSQNRENER